MTRFLLLLVNLFCLWSFSQAATSLLQQCAPEFEPCYFKDCCDGLLCATTADPQQDHLTGSSSTCFSQRSIALASKSEDDKLEMIRRFYEELVPPASRKSTQEIERMVEKHTESHSFPKLVARLEKRYKMTVSEETAYGEVGEL